MRLIDADQFGVISLQGKNEDFIEGAKFMLEKIDEAPTVERPHGEWGKRTYGYLSTHDCSNCGFNGNQLWHFCPNCGAVMSEEGQRFADGFCEGLQSMREGEVE